MAGKESETKSFNETTVSSYSKNCANVYDDPQNKNFVYGEITIDFLRSIRFGPADRSILDIGCGTGFGFEVLEDEFSRLGMQGIGVEPAQGMLDLAIEKFHGKEKFAFLKGSFECIPVEDCSVDRIISTLALHWASSIEVAIEEMKRVLKPGGGIDLLMIAKDDGAKFKRPVVEAMKKHLTFSQIMHAATLALRIEPVELKKAVEKSFGPGYSVVVKNPRRIILGSFEEHMKWWTARSSAIIANVKNKTQFFRDLKSEMAAIATGQGIPFDLSCLFLRVKGHSNG